MNALEGLRETAFSPFVLWIIWGVVALVWCIMSGILVYHWRSYSKGDHSVKRMSWIYFICSLLLLGSSVTFILPL